tara:strand:+ start:539 stop:2905 length:2367 start_codon:yes stop_codon:yes gene_type:complete
MILTMPTPAEIDTQIQLEREAIAQGLKRLRSNVQELEEKDYASATTYGISSIDTLLPHVIKHIQDTFEYRIERGHNGVAFKEIHQYLSHIEPLALAAIGCKVTFDKVFGRKPDSNLVMNVTSSIGKAVEDECHMRHYEKVAPGLLNTLKKNYWHDAIGTQQKVTVISTLIKRYEVEPWVTWPRSVRVRLGTWLLDCIMHVSGWFTTATDRRGKKTYNLVVPTPDFLKVKNQIINDSEIFAPLAWPMLIEPNDWSNERCGGYLLNEVMKGHPMVRRGDNTRLQGETPIAFLNRIQKVEYRLSNFTVQVAEELYKRGISVGKFIPIVSMDLPPKPPDIADNKESRKRYRREAAEVMNENASAFRRSCRTRMTMEAIERFKNKTFYIPWSFDYRGRAYPIPAFLTPQDTDYGKSLLRFADEKYINNESAEWLAFQVATTYGRDKDTWDERQAWVLDNLTLISRVANNPIRYLPDWEAAEEPWQFLAACEEYYNCVVMQTRRCTGLMVAIDATCSGLQILAGLASDKSTAQLVNVLPSDRPQDAYKAVAEYSKPNIPERLRPYWDRKATKRSVMTIPYNAKPYSNRTYIRDALKEKGIEIEQDELTQAVKAVRGAMDSIVPGPMDVMKWIEKEVGFIIREGKKKADVVILEWETPSGFIVYQRLMEIHEQKLQLQLLGKCKVSVITDDDEQVSIIKHKAATAPNLIHSLDASLLQMASSRFDAPLATIHDSVLTRATDMSKLSTLVRETYMDLFANTNYLQDFATAIGAKTEPPIIGDLEPSDVIDSTYFFC